MVEDLFEPMGKAMADEICQVPNPPSSGMPLRKPMKAAILTQSYLLQKYTLEPQGIWARVHRIFAVDPSRSSGIPLNPQFRNPPPGAVDPNAYDDPVTIPAGDIADNPYWKRDVRRSYPQLSTVTQGDVVALLTVGSKASPKDDVLQIGDAGAKQLVEVKQGAVASKEICGGFCAGVAQAVRAGVEHARRGTATEFEVR